MSTLLIILTVMMVALALRGIIKPAALFEFPTMSAFIMLAYILPQAWAVDRSGEMMDMSPELTWSYMILCMIMVSLGFYLSYRSKNKNTKEVIALEETHYPDRLFIGSLILCVIGAVAFFEMKRLASTAVGNLWTGPLAFYYMISILASFGASLSWLLYLKSGSRKSMILALASFSISLPAILYDARREQAFTLVSSLLLGWLFVKKRAISRVLLIPMLLVGTLLIVKASDIRQLLSQDESATLITAVTDDRIYGAIDRVRASEVPSAVSDINYVTTYQTYDFFAPYFNTFVQLYVPAFIVGREFKESLMFDIDSAGRANAYNVVGATRTGFSDTFVAFHYSGALVFLAISYFMGMLWRSAHEGNISAQLYYMVLLPPGLKTITESTAIFVGDLPLVFGSVALVFYASRKRTKQQSRLTDPTAHAAGTPRRLAAPGLPHNVRKTGR